MIPKRSGDRVRTDRRDAEMLARLYRAGELSAVYVPHPEDEAVRDLTRARHQLKAFLLRSGIRYTGKTAWTPAHVRWIAGIKLDQPVQQNVVPIPEAAHHIHYFKERSPCSSKSVKRS
jgi:transposase